MEPIDQLDKIPDRGSRIFLVEPDWDGLSCEVLQQQDELLLTVDGRPVQGQLIDEVIPDLRKALPEDVWAYGVLELYVDHARQSGAFARSVLNGVENPPQGARLICRLCDLRMLANESLSNQAAGERRRALERCIRPQGCVTILPSQRMRGCDLDQLPMRHGLRYRLRAVDQSHEAYLWEPAAVLSSDAPVSLAAVSLGVLSTVALAQRLVAAEQALVAQRLESQRLRLRLDAAEERLQADAPFAGLGRETVERLRRQALQRLRAFDAAEGRDPVRAKQIADLEADRTAPGAVVALHAQLEQVFAAVFPTQPRARSSPLEPGAPDRARLDCEAFRCPRAHLRRQGA